MATFKVTTTYQVTEYVEAPADTDHNDVAGEAQSRYISFSDLNEVGFEVEEMVSA